MTGVRHHRWDDLPREELNPSIGRRLITGDAMMIAHVYLAKGAVVPKHSHHNEQITYILEGVLRFRLGDEQSEIVDVAAGEVLTIPADVPHAAEALDDTLDVDIFTPPRADWLDGTDTYPFLTRVSAHLRRCCEC
jgi:quercetin dioxygenase-like cupin family protein